ncbi:MAG TPA: nucleoside triphosphate pyrophosphohydrolase family protein [Gemmatimonadaceae bacterium]|nr:nucleoside triphosphate pyrophosphohydrolase family protein [Gemmatimonadaceae bacterium]
MTLDEYQRAAARTLNQALSDPDRLLDAAAGLAEEAGEVLGQVRKHAFMGHALDRDALASELGDALWCLSACALALGVSLDEVAGANLAKLRSRYPEGYSDERSRAGREPGDR